MLFNFSIDMRYVGQEYYVSIPVSSAIDLKKIEKDFHKTYNDKYGHSQLNAPVEITNLRLAAFGLIDRPIDYSKNDTEFEIRSPYANLKAKVVPLPFFDPKKRIPIK